jgi:hypothetical protein
MFYNNRSDRGLLPFTPHSSHRRHGHISVARSLTVSVGTFSQNSRRGQNIATNNDAKT